MTRLLIAGAGSIGSRHLANAARLVQAAVFDPNPVRATQAAALCDAPFFYTLEEALEWRPDGVVIAAPTHLHLTLAERVLDAGIHVLVEKPISHTLEGVKALLKKAEARSLKFHVACNMRFHPALEAIHAALPEVGKPLFARAHVGNYLPSMRPGRDYRELYCARRVSGGGVILDSIHELDYLCWLFGPALRVTCSAAKLSALDIDVEDWAAMALAFESGIRAEVHMDYLRPIKRRGLEITGDKGLLHWISEDKAPERCTVRLFRMEYGTWETLLQDTDLNATGMYRKELEHFLSSISGGLSHLATGEEGAAALALAIAARDSALSGSETTLKDIT